MADLRVGSTPFFDRGIERVLEWDESAALPRANLLAPSASFNPGALDQILGVRNYEALIDDYVRPQLVVLELLAPQVFREAARRARAHLESRRQLKASKVLADEEALRELLDDYRRALMQG